MDVVASRGFLSEFAGDVVALGVLEPEEKERLPELHESAKRIDSIVGGVLKSSVEAKEFTGKLGSICVYRVKGIPARIVLLVGLGKRSTFEDDVIRQAAGKACCAARELNAKRMAFCVDSVCVGGVDAERAGRLLTEGAILGLYSFEAYKSEKEEKQLKELHLLTSGDAKAVMNGAEKGEIVASSANIVREICNDPANYATPKKIADIAVETARRYGFKCKVLEKKDIEMEKMGGILSVSSGSAQPPLFVVLEYNGAGKGEKPYAIIGKGITFDSGGISLKPSQNMDKMKFDKAGACAVLGIFVAVSRMKMKINLVGLMPLTENLPSGSAARPGDIIKTRSGKTVEIISTDAEGRVILADAIDYAKTFGPRAIIDLATLTGACVVALGYECSGLMGNDEKLLAEIEKAGIRSGEKVWRLPMWKEYNEYNKSDVADIKNVGPSGGAGGTIAGGKFLESFVPKDVPWAHIDIAGTAWKEQAKPYFALGATGVGVRLLTAFFEEFK